MPFSDIWKDIGKRSHERGSRLYDEENHREAEREFRVAVAWRTDKLGELDKSTLSSKYRLGASLYQQTKYGEAADLFRQVASGREKVFGPNHKDTLSSRYWLGISLYPQGKYSEAEQNFRQAASGWENVFGPSRKETLTFKDWLGVSLSQQQKYSEAEQYFRQTVSGREKVLGPDHKDTLRSKDWLARSLLQGKQQQQINARNEASQGTPDYHLGVQSTGDVYANEIPQSAESLAGGDESKDRCLENTLGSETAQLDDFFTENESPRSTYKDSEIAIVSRLLAHQNLEWSRVPRTYIVLRNINCLHLLDSIIAFGFTDHWFPVVAKDLPTILHTNQKLDFVNAQNLVLTKSLDLEKGAEGQHCYFFQGDTLPLEEQRVLGQGEFGQVEEVLSLVSYQRYARKRVLRTMIFPRRKPEHISSFILEIETLKRLQHKHIVQFVGSYSDIEYLALLMRPVAEMNLSVYLNRPDISSRFGELRTFFGCLATALDFLHTQSVRHEDIKPANILIDHGNILFTDFGLSYDFADAEVSTTMSMVNRMISSYSAPEVAFCEPRDKSSDIWSLGVVYLEMLVTLKGMTREYKIVSLAKHGTPQPFIVFNREGFTNFVESLKSAGSQDDNQVINWINDMLQVEGRNRPHTASLVATIRHTSENQYGSQSYCGLCCLQ